MIRIVAVLMGVLVVAAFALPVLRRPGRTIFPLFAATLPIASVISLPIPLPSPFNTLSSFLGGLAIVAGAIDAFVMRRFRLPSAPTALWLLFLAWISASVFWAIDSHAAYTTLKIAVPLLVLLLLASTMRFDDTDLAVWRVAIISGGVLVGLFAAALILTGRALPTHGVSARFSLVTNPQDTDPNILAVSLILPLVLSVECCILGGKKWWKPRTWRLIGTAGLVFVLIALLLTGSRGGGLAAGVALIYAVAMCRRIPEGARFIRGASRSLGAIFMVIIVGFGLLRLLGAPVLSGLTGVQPIHRLTTTTSSGRFEIWKTGLVACKLHCGAGSGLGTFEAAYNEAFALTSISRDVGFNRPAHDVYLDLVVETGFLGLTLFLLAMASEWVHFGSAPMLAVSPAFRAAIVGVLIANVFLSAIWFKYFWLPLVVGRVIEGAAASWERDRSLEPGAAPSPDLATALT